MPFNAMRLCWIRRKCSFYFLAFIFTSTVLVVSLFFHFQSDEETMWSDVFQMRFWMEENKNELLWSINMNNKPRLDGVWQRVYGTRNKFYVYAAYAESRMILGVRVIAAVERKSREQVACQLWLPSNVTIKVPARIRIFRDSGSLKYSGAFVVCLLKGTQVKPWETINGWVSVVPADNNNTNNEYITNILVIRGIKPSWDVNYENKIHVCLKPFSTLYTNDLWLLEWLLFNRLLGVSHLYIYNHTMNTRTSNVLQHFQNEGFVTILPWKLPLPRQKIRLDILAYNDCLYRSALQASWLMILTTDELLIPKLKLKLQEMIALAVPKKINKQVHSLFFKTAFFYTFYRNDPQASYGLVTSQKTLRVREMNEYNNLSRFMVQPSEAVELSRYGVVNIVPSEKKSHSGFVSEYLALVHRYQMQCYGKPVKYCLDMPSVVDRAAHSWSADLWNSYDVKKKVIDPNDNVFPDYGQFLFF